MSALTNDQLTIIKEIEEKTDFDVLCIDHLTCDIINRNGSDNRIQVVDIENKNIDEIINSINLL